MKLHPITTAALLAFLSTSPVLTRAAAPTADELTVKAGQGDAEAQYRLAQACQRGIEVKKDLRKSYDLMKQASDQGHADATGGLGYFHANGIIVKKDLATAAEYFRKGAEANGPRSKLNYGRALLYGRGVEKNVAEGVKWIDKALSDGVPDACFAKGEFYFNGTFGHSQDYERAREYLQKAADADNAPAENMIGTLYRNGLGVPRDVVKAEHWFRKAAEQGDPKGMSNLGQLLGPDGPDATKHVEALKWLLLAHRANEPMAGKILNEILSTRPAEVVKQAQKLVVEFKSRLPSPEGPQAPPTPKK